MFDLPDIDIQHVWTFAAGHVWFCLHFVLLHIGTFLEPIMPHLIKYAITGKI